MTDDSPKLSKRARQCLRLAYDHRTVDQIADALGISVSRVNQHFTAARAYYRVGRTQLAVQRLAEEEGLAASAQSGQPYKEITGQESAVPDRPRPRLRMPLRTTGEPHNDLTPLQILVIGFAIALASIALLALAGTVLETVTHVTKPN